MGAVKRTLESKDGEDRPRKKSKAPREVDESLLDGKLGVNKAFELMDSQLLADHLAQKTTRFGKDLTSVELHDLSIPS
jgi:protein CMS1